MKPRAKSFIVPINLYMSDVLYFFGSKDDLFVRLQGLSYNNVDGLKSHKFGKGLTAMDDGGRTFVWMPEVPTTADHFATLAHETFHATCMVLDRKGVEYCEKSEEAFAYLIGYLTFGCYKKLKFKVN